MESLELKVNSVTEASHILKFGNIRVSVLTSRLIRVEKWVFRNEPTQKVWYRNFALPEFTAEKKGNKLIIKTLDVIFEIFVTGLVKAYQKDGTRLTQKGNLLGTARTLDNVNGKTKLGKGLVSKGGLSVLDDSKGLIIEGDKIQPYTFAIDKYYFAFGDDYRGCLKAFYMLTGEIPLIPKYALGNWWSRYKAYTQQEYIDLMQKFIDKKIPIKVATVDMDWHWVNVVERFGKESKKTSSLTLLDKFFAVVLPGWTGYSWNTDLFPDHKQFLNYLKENGFKVPLNIHPSQGIRFFEDQYEAVCERVGVDPKTKQPVTFDLSNQKFIEAYFELVHHPLEEEGVDLWWIDWQQGKRSQIRGLDPLWALNHYHYLDSQRGNKRGLILSRFASIGSHRYPLGFSGDTVITWKSLDFQPYFTSTASNVGYTWWSHDIGGHRSGVKNDELYLRWLQFGVFSPINRLHSTANEFAGKEPWNCSSYVENIATKFLKLRHKLVPYIYTAAYNSNKKGIAICEPLYYTYKTPEAYSVKNEYIFGGKLICAPVTCPLDKVTKLAKSQVYLPEEQRYTDIFTGYQYKGGKVIEMYRDLESFPCLAKEGSIIPMYKNCDTNSMSLDEDLEIWIYRGTGSYYLYEDDGESFDYKTGKYAISSFAINETATGYTFAFKPQIEGELELPNRKVTLVFKDISSCDMFVNGEKVELGESVEVTIDKAVQIELKNCTYPTSQNKKEWIKRMITKYQMKNFSKTAKFLKYVNGKGTPKCSKRLLGPIKEIEEIL